MPVILHVLTDFLYENMCVYIERDIQAIPCIVHTYVKKIRKFHQQLAPKFKISLLNTRERLIHTKPISVINTRVIEFLRNFEFRNWHTMRGGLMLPDSISEEKLEID